MITEKKSPGINTRAFLFNQTRGGNVRIFMKGDHSITSIEIG